MPKISVVMPVYNGEKYIRESIDSILNQTFADFELIIINDCSTDSTEDIIKSYSDKRIRYIKNEKNLGVASSLNRGLDIAQGDYIARQDADDISFSDRFCKQLEFMENHSNVAVCGAETEVFGDVEPHVTYTVFGSRQVKVAMLFSASVAHPVVMMRNDILQRENYRYDKEFDKVEDYDLWLRIGEKYDIDNAHGVMLRYRLHNNQVTRNYSDDYDKKIRKIRKREFDRLEFSYTEEEFDAFCNYCGSGFDYDNQIKELASLFQKIYTANLSKKYYDILELKSTINKILISCLDKSKTNGYKDISRICGILSSRYFILTRVKKQVKKYFKRD